MAHPDVLAALDPEQRAAASALRGPVCVIAGAGTGKTRAITHRIAHGVLVGAYEPQRVLAVTFTTRAAGEMRGRLQTLGVDGVQARTFHSAALRQARYFWPEVTGANLPRIAESKLPLLATAATQCRVGTGGTMLRDLASEIEWAKVTDVSPEAYPSAAAAAARGELPGADQETVGRVYAAYEEVKAEKSLIDMEDILLAAVGLLSEHPGVADKVRAQYHHFVVDEYQDVSPLQQKLLDLWLGERDDVCVVGDPAQTIYSFAGARPDFLVQFPHRYPHAEVVRLVRDYRSSPQVVGVANAVLQRSADPAARAAVTLQAQRPDGPATEFAEHADEIDEADWVADRIRSLVDGGTAPREIAVLFRVNAQSEAYEHALGAAGVPYLVRGAERFFERAEVQQAVRLLRAATRSGDAGPEAPDGAAATAAVLASAGWQQRPPSGGGAARDRWESLQAIVDLAQEVVAAKPAAGVAEVVAELEARAALQHAPVADGVTLASLHSAKGLEWDVVFVVGCQEGTLPLVYADTPAEIDEERRLFYVGITRARHRLAVSWSLARTPGVPASRRRSHFLDGVAPGSAPRRGPAARRPERQAPPRCRVCGTPLTVPADRKIGRCSSCPAELDEALYERLRRWRLERAERLRVPAYVVFTDATLIAIAEQRPADERALAAVPGVGRVKLDRYGDEVLELCVKMAEERAKK